MACKGTCEVAGCGRKATAKRLCTSHYRRLQKGISLDTPIREKAPRGEGKTKKGYVRVWSPILGKYEFEHRVVMRRMLGRELFEYENVHHKNGIRSDNNPDNLELWSKSQPAGQRVEDKIAWCKAFLKQYGEAV